MGDFDSPLLLKKRMRVLGIILGFLIAFAFGMAGLTKLTPDIEPNVHQEHIENFPKLLPWMPAEHVQDFRMAIGGLEVASALFWILPGTSFLAVLIEVPILIGVIHAHITSGVGEVAPPAVLLVLAIIAHKLKSAPQGKKKKSN